MVIFLLKFLFYSHWAKCVDKLSLLTVLLVDSQPRRAHYFAKQSIVRYTLLIRPSVFFRIFLKVFLSVMYWKAFLENIFNLCPTSFFSPSLYFLLRFWSYESTEDKLSLYHIWTLVRRFAGVFCKSFLPPHYNWKVTSRLLGYFTKILQKFFRYNWFFADRNISVFSKNLKYPPHILDICISFGVVFSEK